MTFSLNLVFNAKKANILSIGKMIRVLSFEQPIWHTMLYGTTQNILSTERNKKRFTNIFTTK